ncbi:hypothetical protein [Neolewinella antarctica]|uniref:Uncharacterized protein n=1 Tax=Neolewinella antarctica TaxID=442734 RepID=A0ABX0XHD9_9BACT|nr:hypothetical protein [Neolewinella antarctica]NJC28266.1 hypothetical protein [Neolewinella antarctica]
MKKVFYIIGSILVILVIFFSSVMFLHDKVIEERVSKTPEQLREELEVKELLEPKVYLSVKTNLRDNIKKGNLFKRDRLDGHIISGNVSNKANFASYKDVVVQLTFYSKTKTQIGQDEFIIYEIYSPGVSKDFSYKIEIPNSTDSYDAIILKAQGLF